MPACIKGGVRHLDWISGFNGEQVGREKIGSVLDIGPLDSRSAGDLIAKMNSGEIERLIIHLAEGRSSDRDSKDEFAKLTQLGLLHGKTTIIHGTALGALEFNDMAKAGASLVWSPRSNFVLYNETTDIKTAKAKGVTIALAPDWGITGSANMLAELSYARSVTSEFTDKELFEMATAIPARMAALDRMIGAIKIGAAADLLVLKAKDPDAYRNLVLAEPQDVQLVLVGGAVRYGSLQNVSTVANGSSAPANISLVDACGEQKAIEYSPRTSLGDKLQNLLRRIRARLGDFHVAPAPLIECP